jgi:soluble lytic murein transglycosylase
LRLLAEGVEALEGGRIPQAIHALKGARTAVPALEDYALYYLAQANYQGHSYAEAAAAAEGVAAFHPASPLQARACVVGARAYLEENQARKALGILARVNEAALPMPAGRLLRARALEATGAAVDAAADYQVVYAHYPQSEEAREAGEALEGLRETLGARYPQPGELRLERAEKLADAHDIKSARRELQSIAADGSEREREQARVRMAALEYEERDTVEALHALTALGRQSAEVEPERQYWIAQCQRRLERDDDMAATIDLLARTSATSPWRLKALEAASNRYLVKDDPRQAGVFGACAGSFPEAKEAGMCQWHAAWWAYRHGESGAAQLLRQHLVSYPASEKAGAAIYYLGRLALKGGDNAAALAWFRFLTKRYPNYYYTFEARPELERLEARRLAPAPAVTEFLAQVRFPERPTHADFTADAATARRIERARLLDRAELESLAEEELRYGARNGANPWSTALELAEMATRNGAPDRALRHIKGVAPTYMFLPREGAPERFWRLAFPMPYRALIEKNAVAAGLDPYLVAALIRQESEFNPKAVSASKAVGLMQILPAVGRELARKAPVKGFRASQLTRPDVNIRLGVFYFRRLLDSCDGRVEDALASYNAGHSRVVTWREWGPFQEPSEFVETIPFMQTRDYVQIIERNAEMYRSLYAHTPLAEPAAPAKPAKKPAREKAKRG